MERQDVTAATLRVAIDLHCHILPGLDDGAHDLADAVAMAEQARADGIDAICATPHIRRDHDVVIDELPDRIAELNAALRTAACPVKVLPGGEVASGLVEALEDHELRAVSLGGSAGWILLEPEPGPLDERLDRAVHALQRRGLGVVVAHPERHLTADLAYRLGRLALQGALIQATAASLVDEVTLPGMLKLARAGVIHVLGSDSHSSQAGRPVALGPAFRALSAVAPVAGHLTWVARTAPVAIVRGEQIRAPFAPQT